MAMARRPYATLAAMCAGTFMAILDTSLVSLGLHAIERDLHADMPVLQWVIDSYNLAYSASILVGGTIADLYGRRRTFLIGTSIFALGTLGCALAPGAGLLIAARGVTGVGAALLLPAGLAILNVTFRDTNERARAIAIWGGMNGLAMAIGPTVGGVLVDWFGWRSLFYAILPPAALTLALAFLCVGESADPEGRRLDLPGHLLAIISLFTLSLGLIEAPSWGWHSPAILACFAMFLVSGIGFIATEHRTRAPLLPLDTFRVPAFSAGAACAWFMTFGMYGLLFVLPLYLQAIQGHSATRAGCELLPMSVTFFMLSLFAGRIALALGPRVVVTGGMALTGVGMLILSGLSTNTNYVIIAAALFVVGIGLGLVTGPIATVSVANAPPARSGMSSGVVNVARMTGATFGVAILGLLFGQQIESAAREATTFLAGLHAAFLIGGASEMCGALVAVLWLHRHALEAAHEPG